MFIYVLRCVDGAYYVGKTEKIAERFKQHRAGEGSVWTTKHGVDAMVDLIECGDDDCMEISVTLKYILKYGKDKVRGSIWCTETLSMQDDKLIDRLLASWMFPKKVFKGAGLVDKDADAKEEEFAKEEPKRLKSAVWSTEEHEQFVRALKSGESVEAIAAVHSRSVSSIKTRIKHMQTRGHHLYDPTFKL